MIDDYRSLAVFDAVANAGSFSAAAKKLRLSTSVVSHHVSKLEAKLGVSLLYRSTRSLSLTPEGKLIRESVRAMVTAGEDALDLLAEDMDQPVGALRIAVPAFGRFEPAQEKIWNFARAHPHVSISLSSSDRSVDLIKEGFDIGIRLGKLSDSNLKSRKVGTFQRAMVASKSYLETRGPITTFEDLRTCDFVSFAMLPDEITLIRDGETVSFTPENTRLEVDSVVAAKAAICKGLGVQRLPRSEVAQELKSGELIELLPDWHPPELGVFAVWPDSGPQKKLTRRLIDFLTA